MMRRLSVLLTAVVLVSAACGDSGPVTTTATTEPAPAETTSPPAVTTTTAASFEVTEAASPPPSSFAEVAAEYTAAADVVLSEGRNLADLFLTGQDEALYDRFGPVMTSQLSVEDIGAGRDEIESQAPLGDFGLERAVQLSPTSRFYGVEIEWGEETLIFNAAFDEAGEVASLFLTPELPLPPDPTGDFASDVEFRLPFEGLWLTFWGGDTAVENYHVDAPVQRHAFDFLVWQDGGTHAGDGSAVEDYWAYGQRVLAPAAGTVVTAVDGLPDQVPQTGSDTANPAGNHLVIEVATGEFLLIAHMQAGSLTVAEGDVVEAGQQIGLVGNSGTTTEPHIHIHLQDLPVFLVDGTGLNLEFTGYLANGEPVERDQPLADQFVVNG
jgi:murein DD-endopeptidase MepM/ murein hydrolase activator NlpD